MLRVVFETRLEDVNGVPQIVRLNKLICPQELNLENQLIAGYRIIKLHSVEEVTFTERRTRSRHKVKKADDSWKELHARITKRLARSRYRVIFTEALHQLAQDMEWDAVVKRAGFKGVTFRELWQKFKKAAVKTFWFSVNTRAMLTRVEREPWLAPLILQQE